MQALENEPALAPPTFARTTSITERLQRALTAVGAPPLADLGPSPFRNILDTTTDAVFLKDTRGRYLFINPAGAAVLGKRVDEVIGKDDLAFFAEPICRKIAQRDRELLFSGQVRTVHEVHGLNGVERHFVVTKGPFVDDDGNVMGIFGVAHDVTDWDRIATDRLQLVEELTHAVRARDDFVSIASHELKTPITALQLLVETTASRALGKGTPEARLDAVVQRLELVQQQTTKLTRLVELLLDVSRISSGKLELQLDRVDLVDVVRGVVELHRLELDKAECAVTVEVPSELWGMWDAIRVEQVLANLITNAIKYAPGQPIEIRLSHEEGCAVLSVQDRGAGIRSEDQERIFERFERVGETLKTVTGFGLGLWIVRQVVEAHGGALSVQSQVNEGSTFTVVLPCDIRNRGVAREAVAPKDTDDRQYTLEL